MMARRTVIEQASGHVANVIVLKDESKWTPPKGHIVGPGHGEIGDTWDGASFIRPAVVPVPPVLSDPQKLTVIGRMTDTEISQLRTFLSTRPRAAERWQAMTRVESSDIQTRQVFRDLFGAARAAELLAPE